MLISDLTVEVRNSSLARVGQILPADLRGLELALRFNKVGSWKLTLRSDHPLVDSLRSPGAGLIVTGPTGVIISGPTVSATNTKTSEDPTGSWDIVGVDDSVMLGERLAYPVPATADLTAQTSAYDSRTGKAETIAKAYVNANMGPSAPVARRVSGLTIDTDLGRGSTLAVNARFDKLGELLEGILVVDALGFDIKQVGAGLVFEVFQPVDRTASIRMDVDNLRLTKSEYTYTAPGATRVIVAGQGEGATRTFLERVSSASTAAETAWGRRIEVFKDQRNTNDTTALQSAGDEILSASGKTIEGMKVTPSDDQTMRYGVDWGLGDKVTVVVGTTQVAQVVTEVAIVVTDDGIKVGATVGDPVVAGDDDASMLDATTSQEARISNLERSDTTPAVTTAKLADGAVTTAKLADSSVTSAKIVDGAIVDADINASAGIAVSKLAASSVTVNGSSVTLGSSVVVNQSYNYVLNGGFDIWQRGTSGLATAANATTGYTADRWQLIRATYAAGATVSRISSGLTGFTYAARVQRTSGNTSTAAMTFSNFYESDYCRQLAGKTVTLSMYIRRGSNYSGGAVSMRVYTGTGTDERRGSGFTGAVNSVTTDITPTTTWTRYTVTGTIPSNATQWSTEVSWTPSGTAGANDFIEVTGVQLEEGSVATDFRRQNATLGAELSACQYYYMRFAPGVTGGGIGSGFVFDGTNNISRVTVPLPTSMRATPTTSFSALAMSNGVTNAAVSSMGVTSTVAGLPNIGFLNVSHATGFSAGASLQLATTSASGSLTLDAEL